MSVDHGEKFHEATKKIEEAYADGLRAFVAWLENYWQHETPEQWAKQYNEPWPGDSRQAGWNECLATLAGALDVYMDEFR